ncbi:transglutaminaseTgpA domain-containing protein [Nocardioides caldifontis]|uniref:transglutaminase family protein n=1 Tax=Nocardioides caldifontis TaxID=2588938 RepID=UPI001396760C|nr:DUF3488 and transglutaminase-like domain-containing protein [Nocardioides caldifontis]
MATALLAAGATFFTLLAWDGLSDDASGYLVPLFFICLSVGAMGLALRALRLPRPLVPLTELLIIGLVLHWWWASEFALAGLVPTGDSAGAAFEVLRRSAEATERYAAPVPARETGFAPIMVAAGAAVAVSVDTLACTFRRVPLAGLPLLAAFTVPVAILGGVSWVTFGLAASCFLLLMAAEQVDVIGNWSEPLAGARGTAQTSAQSRPPRLRAQWSNASRIGLLGIGVAVAAPVLLPFGDGILGQSLEPRIAGAGGGVRLQNPLVDIKRDLTRGADTPLVVVRTDDPDPTYLRLSVLDEFDGMTWRPSERDLPSENQAIGDVPPPEGLEAATPRREFSWSIEVLEAFDTAWLPTPYPYTEVTVDGDWRYDLETMDLTSPGGEMSGAGVQYDVVGLEPSPDQQALVAAAPAPLSIRSSNTVVPDSFPAKFEELAEEVTASADSSFERAVMLQNWFREDGGFTYSLDREEGNGIEQLELFLGTGPGSRVGYCEQFASAMATMARSLNIPARVAVGFLEPQLVDDTYVYSAHDLHAWPELYFDGVGWLRFEPTPPQRASQVPEYTAGAVPAPLAGPTPNEAPSEAVPSPQPAPNESPALDQGVVTEPAMPAWARWTGWIGGAAAVTLLACLPRAVRGWLRRRRLDEDGGGGVEAAWSEVRATAVDLGHGWDDGATLRRRAHDLAPNVGASDNGGPLLALESLVLLVERARYSRSGLDAVRSRETRRLARTVTDAMVAAARPRQRTRATWLPSSLWRGRRPMHRSVTTAESTANRPEALLARQGQSERVSL